MRTALFAGCLVFASLARADDVGVGVAAMRRGDVGAAVGAWTDMVAIGNPAAYNNLAYTFLFGKGVPRDVAHGVQLLAAAADYGYPPAQYNLALIYANAAAFGLGFPGAQTRTTELYRAAAHGGVVRAQYLLGIRTYLGIGTERDPVTALAWLLVAQRDADLELAATIASLSAAARNALAPEQAVEAETLAADLWAELPADVVATTPISKLAPAIVAEQ